MAERVRVHFGGSRRTTLWRLRVGKATPTVPVAAELARLTEGSVAVADWAVEVAAEPPVNG